MVALLLCDAIAWTKTRNEKFIFNKDYGKIDKSTCKDRWFYPAGVEVEVSAPVFVLGLLVLFRGGGYA